MSDIDEGLSFIPQHCRGSMRRYLDDHIRPGGFLSAVLSNDLMATLVAADEINAGRLSDYAKFLHCHAPPECFGSREKFETWLAQAIEAAPC